MLLSKIFKERYPYITITRGTHIPKGSDTKLATHNIECLFETLPEHQRILINLLCTKIKLEDKGICLLIRGQPNITLDTKLFSSFNFSANDPNNDWQRAATAELIEELGHVFCGPIASMPSWQMAIDKDLREANSIRDYLLFAHRTYASYPVSDTVYHIKNGLDWYKKSFGKQAVYAELFVEIMLCKNLLEAAKQYGGRKKFARADIQETLDYILENLHKNHKVLSTSNDEVIDDILKRAFPNSFPIFQDIERNQTQLAETAKSEPSRFKPGRQ